MLMAPCDEIYFGKPHADFYVDDAAVSAFENLEQAMGFFESKNTVEARDFNSISDLSIELIKKQSDQPLTGEVGGDVLVPYFLGRPKTKKTVSRSEVAVVLVVTALTARPLALVV